MSAFVTPMELYHAARETCLRLYLANGGDKRAEWTIRPYPGTAAIARSESYSYDAMTGVRTSRPSFLLAMPAFPMNVKLPRWKSDLVAAYTVHELLHALWTDFEVVKQSHVERVHGLTNAIEDNRIEAKASKGDLLQVSEARRLLVALNAHIAKRALGAPGFSLASPAQFSFVLGLVIFAEKLGYVSDIPADWRAHIKPEWTPLIEHALARFDALRSTADSLALALELKTMAATLPKAQPKPRKPTQPRPAQTPSEAQDAPSREAEIVEDSADVSETQDEDAQEGSQMAAQGQDGDEGADVPPQVNPMPAGAPSASEGAPSDQPSDTPGASADFNDDAPRYRELNDTNASGAAIESEDDDDTADKAGDSAQTPGGRGTGTQTGPDLSDATQIYQEAHLNDLAQDTAREAGVSYHEVIAQAGFANTVLNTPESTIGELSRGGNPKLASAAISSPARLRRHLTMAVKSPERVATERRQVSGRVDMRDTVGIMLGAPNIFRRRIEEEGREAAVTVLIDVSSSMKGEPIAAAKAMALHMGDALKAAGVKFEVMAFDDGQIFVPKPFAKGWALETQRAVAGLRASGGTAMLPAQKAAIERLLRIGNVTRRILLTLTDGQDSFAPQANATLCRWAKQRGVDVVGIALQAYGCKPAFAGRAIEVWNTAQLSSEGLKSLVRALDQ